MDRPGSDRSSWRFGNTVSRSKRTRRVELADQWTQRRVYLQTPSPIPTMASLSGKTIFLTGGSRGIGRAIAIRAARDGANVTIASKTAEPHPKLPGTIHTVAAEIEEAGGHALPLQVDARDEERIAEAIAQTVDRFGGIDIVVNNASAIFLADTANTPMKRYDLMQEVNARATFCTTQAALPHLRESAKAGRNPHVLALSPPLNLDPKWFGPHVAYTMSKYGMSMCVLGWGEELKEDGIAANALWPRTTIATAAVKYALDWRRHDGQEPHAGDYGGRRALGAHAARQHDRQLLYRRRGSSKKLA